MTRPAALSSMQAVNFVALENGKYDGKICRKSAHKSQEEQLKSLKNPEWIQMSGTLISVKIEANRLQNTHC